MFGRIKSYHDRRGFGFIRREGDGVNFFFHASDCGLAENEIEIGARVSFRVERSRDGRTQAVQLTPAPLGEQSLEREQEFESAQEQRRERAP